MTEVLRSPSHFSSPASSPLPCAPSAPSNDALRTLINSTSSNSLEEGEEGITLTLTLEGGRGEGKGRYREGDQLSLLALLVTLLRKSWVACNNSSEGGEVPGMEIGVPTNVRHVAHVTFDRFNGFLGLPVEFEPEVPRRPPSASASVFGVSTESMQLSFDSRGNSVPTILLLMQNRLNAQGGLQAEGIFRINAENSQEEYVRDQLNRGVVPDGVDIHCLAGLIKAWFRELPTGVLDSLSPEQVMQSQSEEECARLASLLPPTEAALLDWAVNLMADIAQLEHMNKMNARNVAMVFAPNMTHMEDPLTALMYAVQVMNFLKTLIIRTLRDRNGFLIESSPTSRGEPSDDNGHHSSPQPFLEGIEEANEENDEDQIFAAEEPAPESLPQPPKIDPIMETGPPENSNGPSLGTGRNVRKTGTGQSSSNLKKGKKLYQRRTMGPTDKSKGSSIVSRINSSRIERVEAWR